MTNCVQGVQGVQGGVQGSVQGLSQHVPWSVRGVQGSPLRGRTYKKNIKLLLLFPFSRMWFTLHTLHTMHTPRITCGVGVQGAFSRAHTLHNSIFSKK